MTIQAEIDTALTIPVMIVQDADRDAPAESQTLTVYWMKQGETSYTDVTSTTTEIEAEDGIYWIILTAGLMDTAGFGVLKITSAAGDEYRDRIQIVDSANAVARPATLTSAIMNMIADHTLRRSLASARASSDGDTVAQRSLMGQIAKYVNRTRINGSSLEVYEEDDATLYYSQSVTTNEAAAPIVEVD